MTIVVGFTGKGVVTAEEAKHYEEQFKDYAFGAGAMREHWTGGFEDMTRSLGHPEFFVPPRRELGVVTHDIHRQGDAA